MKETMKPDLPGDNNKEEFFDFHDKVNTILEEQDEILAIHMAAIKVVAYCVSLLGGRQTSNPGE
jgi:hypothetical protein